MSFVGGLSVGVWVLLVTVFLVLEQNIFLFETVKVDWEEFAYKVKTMFKQNKTSFEGPFEI